MLLLPFFGMAQTTEAPSDPNFPSFHPSYRAPVAPLPESEFPESNPVSLQQQVGKQSLSEMDRNSGWGTHAACATTINIFPYNESFENGFGGWTQSLADNFDWSQWSGSTSSTFTGPDFAYDGSIYLYTEATLPNHPNQLAILEGPCFDLSSLNSPGINFAYHMYGSSMGTMALEVSTDNGVSWSAPVWAATGDKGTDWYNASVSLAPYAGQIIQLRFRGLTGLSFRSDMAIDDLEIKDGFSWDAPCDNCDIIANATESITLPTVGGGSARVGVAFDPNENKYYSVDAGNVFVPIETYDATGSPLANIAAGHDYRGVWYNPVNDSIEGNGYAGPINDGPYPVVRMNRDPLTGFPLGTIDTLFSANQPNDQSCGALDPDAYEIVYYDNGYLWRFSRWDNSFIDSFLVSGIAGLGINVYSAVYTGCPGKEYALYDYNNRQMLFVNRSTGTVVGNSQLPATAPAITAYGLAYANGLAWLYDASASLWRSYEILGNSATIVPISCGVPYSGTTFGSASRISQYSCISWFMNGPEVYHEFTVTTPTTITATLSNFSASLDLFLLDACNAGACISYGNTSLSYSNLQPGTYYLVVDGRNGSSGNYTLITSCGGSADLTYEPNNNNLTVTGTQVNLSMRVVNNGSGGSIPSRVGYYLSTDQTITSSDYYLGDDFVSPLVPGATSSENISVDASQVIPPIPGGTYYAGFIVDYLDENQESNEGNNAFAFASPQVSLFNPTSCNQTISAFPYEEDFESGLGDWEDSQNDSLDWTRRTGPTASPGTGPAAAYSGLYYMYVEATNNNPNKTAGLQSPCLDLSSASGASLSFAYHMLGINMGSLAVEVSTDDGQSWGSPIWSLSGDQGANWDTATVDLTAYAGQVIKVRFFATTGPGFESDIAIDLPRITLSVPNQNPFPPVVATNTFATFLGQVEVENVPASPSDVIAAFDENGNIAGTANMIMNAGIAYFNLTIYGDDATTPGFDEGMNPGEDFTLRLWDASANEVLWYPTIGNPTYFSGWVNTNGLPLSGYDDPNDVYNFMRTTLDTIPLTAGWNLISTDVVPADSTPASVFANLNPGNLLFVTGFDGGSKIYDPNGLPFLNTLTHLERRFGYWVRVITDDTLYVEGDAISTATKKDLDAGWNLVGYIPQATETPANYFASLINNTNLVFVTGFEQGTKIFDPYGLPFLNTLTELRNSLGYWVRVNNAVGGGAYRQSKTAFGQTPTPSFDFFNGQANLGPNAVGKLVHVLSESDEVVAAMEVLEGGYLMTTVVYGDDPTTEASEGLEVGEELRFEFEGNIAPQTSRFRGEKHLDQLELDFEQPVISSISPNPFSKYLELNYHLDSPAHLHIQVYNAQGQLHSSLVNEKRASGQQHVRWRPASLSEGVYFLRVAVDGELVETHRVVKLK